MERICGGTETKETELDVLQRQWNKGVKEIGGRRIIPGVLLKLLVKANYFAKSTREHERETRLQLMSTNHCERLEDSCGM